MIEPHVEATDGRAHEELYLVFRGRAIFTLGEDELDVRPSRNGLSGDITRGSGTSQCPANPQPP